jgi:hypothetical protein
MIKSRVRNGTTSVTFTLAAAVGASQAAICGDWNSWSTDRDVMDRTQDGFIRTVELDTGRTYRFRYLLDGHRWENDWAADGYAPNDYGSEDSVVDLTATPEEVAEGPPPVTDTTAGNKSSAPKGTTAKTASRAKKASTAKKAEPQKPAKEGQSAGDEATPKRTTKRPGR